VAWETKDTVQTAVAALAVVASGLSLVVSCQANEAANRIDNAQLSQIRAVLAATPTGRITSLHNGQILSHRSGPLTVRAHIQHNLGDGDWWVIVHKPLDPKHGNDADAYYPTPKAQSGSKFEKVYVGVPTDTETKTYDVGLYFCKSGGSLSLRNFIASKERPKGLPTLPAGCQLVHDVKVTRSGP
jgi:hypothetical protein